MPKVLSHFLPKPRTIHWTAVCVLTVCLHWSCWTNEMTYKRHVKNDIVWICCNSCNIKFERFTDKHLCTCHSIDSRTAASLLTVRYTVTTYTLVRNLNVTQMMQNDFKISCLNQTWSMMNSPNPWPAANGGSCLKLKTNAEKTGSILARSSACSLSPRHHSAPTTSNKMVVQTFSNLGGKILA